MKKCCILKLDNLTTCIYRGLKGKFSPILDNCSADTLFIEIYENQFFRFDFTHIHVYVFQLSFLSTLNIYKDYFKGRQKVVALVVALVVASIL